MSDNTNDYNAPPAHGSGENPLDHIGEPVTDPILPGAQAAPGADAPGGDDEGAADAPKEG